MKIVKLDATDSTNSYLKDLMRKQVVENWTVITTEHQLKGKGQFENTWVSEKGKNLTFSILVKFDALDVKNQYYLNLSISLAIHNVLKYYITEKLTVKWPNDILSANHKICGILIETVVAKRRVNHAIIGIGLNVNQEEFGKHLLKASSLRRILNREIDADELLDKILLEIQYQTLLLNQEKFEAIKRAYEDVLYKKNTPTMFIDTNSNRFLGKIIGISNNGQLEVELENETVARFGLKEIKFA